MSCFCAVAGRISGRDGGAGIPGHEESMEDRLHSSCFSFVECAHRGVCYAPGKTNEFARGVRHPRMAYASHEWVRFAGGARCSGGWKLSAPLGELTG